MTGTARLAPLLLAPALALAGGCGGGSPPFVGDGGPDTDTAFAPWPPRPGAAGLRLTWSVEGEPPTAAACEDADLQRVRLELVHPLAGFEAWTVPDLERPCPTGELGLDPDRGLEPGRYRFRVTLLHADDSAFQHAPAGFTDLVAFETTLVGNVNVSAAIPGDGGDPRPPPTAEPAPRR
jgi:hypothetical protein